MGCWVLQERAPCHQLPLVRARGLLAGPGGFLCCQPPKPGCLPGQLGQAVPQLLACLGILLC